MQLNPIQWIKITHPIVLHNEDKQISALGQTKGPLERIQSSSLSTEPFSDAEDRLFLLRVDGEVATGLETEDNPCNPGGFDEFRFGETGKYLNIWG